MKGISAIIATILLLLITIALAGTAYMFITGILTGRTAKTISVTTPSCSQDRLTLSVVVSNDGTNTITSGTDLVWIVDAGVTPTPEIFICTPAIILTRTSSICSFTALTTYSGTIRITVVGPSNSIPQTVYC